MICLLSQTANRNMVVIRSAAGVCHKPHGCCLLGTQFPRVSQSLGYSRPRRCEHSKQAAQASGKDFGDEPVDIDQLAKMLSQEAERLRRAQAEVASTIDADEVVGEAIEEHTEEVRSISEELTKFTGVKLGPFGYESKLREAEVLAEVGDGGFCVSEFEVIQELGRISIQQVSEELPSLDAPAPTLPQRRKQEETAVIAFKARYFSGMAYETPLPTFVKEYLPGAKAIACNELLVMRHLTGLPENKWTSAAAPLTDDVPVVPLLGYFVAGQSDAAMFASSSIDVVEDTLWLVYKWDGLLPLALYPSANHNRSATPAPPQGPAMPAFLSFGTRPQADPKQMKWNMLRRYCAAALRCVGWCHERGVVHGSLSASSFLVNTFDDERVDEVIMKVTDFGFARLASRGTSRSQGDVESPGLYPRPIPLGPDDSPQPSVAYTDDVTALGVALLDTVMMSLTADSPSVMLTSDSLQRLLFEVFSADIHAFRRYCAEDVDLAPAVEFLDDDDGSGWEFMDRLLCGSSTVFDLLSHPFLKPS